MEFLAHNLAPIMFMGLIVFRLLGFPVAFSLGACGLFFGLIGIELGALPEALLQALPLRIFGIMQNDTLLAEIFPPSIVLIVLVDRLGRSVVDMCKGECIPGFLLTGFYTLYIVCVALFKPKWVPALPLEARTIRADNRKTGLPSLLVLTVVSVALAIVFAKNYDHVVAWWNNNPAAVGPTD